MEREELRKIKPFTVDCVHWHQITSPCKSNRFISYRCCVMKAWKEIFQNRKKWCFWVFLHLNIFYLFGNDAAIYVWSKIINFRKINLFLGKQRVFYFSLFHFQKLKDSWLFFENWNIRIIFIDYLILYFLRIKWCYFRCSQRSFTGASYRFFPFPKFQQNFKMKQSSGDHKSTQCLILIILRRQNLFSRQY